MNLQEFLNKYGQMGASLRINRLAQSSEPSLLHLEARDLATDLNLLLITLEKEKDEKKLLDLYVIKDTSNFGMKVSIVAAKARWDANVRVPFMAETFDSRQIKTLNDNPAELDILFSGEWNE